VGLENGNTLRGKGIFLGGRGIWEMAEFGFAVQLLGAWRVERN